MHTVSKPERALSLTSIVWLLGLTQIVGYGTMYYTLAIVAADIASELSVPVSTVFASLSLALLAGGAAAPYAGKLIDRRGAAQIMTIGSGAAAVALAAVAVAPNLAVFVIGLMAVEIAGALVLYDAAFACIVQNGGSRRRITHLTLIAGFASTIFWPLTSSLSGLLTWREIIAVYAVLHVACCLPAHWWLARSFRARSRNTGVEPAAVEESSEAPLPQTLRRPVLLLIALGFALSGFLILGITAQMVPVLAALGLGTAGVVVSMLFGPAQVLARLINMSAGSGQHPLTITILMASLLPVSALLLWLTAPSIVGAAAFAVLFGLASGLKSIVQGTLPLALFGREAYAERLGWLASARLILTAVAPFIMAYLTDTAGVSTALLTMTAFGFVGLGLFLIVRYLRNRALSVSAPLRGRALEAVE